MSGTIFPDNRSRIFEGKRTIISSNRLICSNYVHLCTVDIDLRKSENAIGMLDLLLVILCTKSTTFSLILRLNPLLLQPPRNTEYQRVVSLQPG